MVDLDGEPSEEDSFSSEVNINQRGIVRQSLATALNDISLNENQFAGAKLMQFEQSCFYI